MRADAVALLACPHCGGRLAGRGGALVCARHHSFDIARQGYVSLLTGAARADLGDTADMVAAREAFLRSGHFQPIADALAHHVTGTLGDVAGCVVDVGAGTGYYLAYVLDAHDGVIGLALDGSKHALRRAARAHERVAAVACDVWSGLPLRNGVAAVALNVFAPRHGAELARVLAPGGALVVVTPTPRHLRDLVEPLGLVTVDPRKSSRLARTLEPHLRLVERVESDHAMVLGHADLADLVAMGPSGWHRGRREIAEALRALPEPLSLSASIAVSIYRHR